jgi:APA family basic amino acid/polyamine antiporter
VTAVNQPSPQSLDRQLHLPGAIVVGLGSILGTGAFVSIGIGAGVAGPMVILACALAAVVATFNGLSSAQLAAAFPVSGGTYEYARRTFPGLAGERLGFIAGWLFLIAKSASAATAALGCAGYLRTFIGGPLESVPLWLLALGVLALLTAFVLVGLRRTSTLNTALVSTTIVFLLLFIAGNLVPAINRAPDTLLPFFEAPADADGNRAPWGLALASATALMFVAYTGYGRIATLGEEVVNPRKTIPRAVIATLVVSMLLYVGIAFALLGPFKAGYIASVTERDAAPLLVGAQGSLVPGLAMFLWVGAVTAMLGVLLNLLLGLSRVLLAMGRNRDMPSATARLTTKKNPAVAILVMAAVIGAIVAIGDLKLAWSFSAFTVLIYYAITNAAAIRLPKPDRLYPPILAWCGLISCAVLAFFVETQVWLIGLALIALGLLWHEAARRLRPPSPLEGEGGREATG